MKAAGLMMQKVRYNQQENPELKHNTLPADAALAKKVTTNAQKGYYVVDVILNYEKSSVSGCWSSVDSSTCFVEKTVVDGKHFCRAFCTQ